MSAIAYSVAAALIGTSAAVASQIVTATDEPVKHRVEVISNVANPSYDFDKFAAQVVTPVNSGIVVSVERLKPIRLAAVSQGQLRVIVRDEALAQKADSLAAEAANAQSSVIDENFLITGEEVTVPAFESPAIVPLPKVRPSLAALQTEPKKVRRTTRRKAVSKRKLQRPIRVAEAKTTAQARLARRLRSKGWLIGAFR